MWVDIVPGSCWWIARAWCNARAYKGYVCEARLVPGRHAAVHDAVVWGKVGQGRCLPRMLGAGTGALVIGSTRDERLRRGEAAGPLTVRRGLLGAAGRAY